MTHHNQTISARLSPKFHRAKTQPARSRPAIVPASHGVNLLLFNVAARHGMRRNAEAPGGRLIITGRFGAGPTLPHTESSVEGQRQEQYEVGRLGWQAAGGAEFNLWRGLYILGEYKFTRTRQRGKVSSGTAESVLRTHHGVFGLSYHF